MPSSTVAIIITVIVCILLVVNKFPFCGVSCLAAVAMGILIPEMELSQIYSGFGGSAVVMVAGMCIVSDALFQTGVAQQIGARICKTWIVGTEKRFIVAGVVICTVQSAFMSNSGVIAMWMPLIATIAAGSNGKIRSKMVIFPAGTAAIVGGACTLVGSTAQVVANSILMGTPGYEAGLQVFDMTLVMIPVSLLQVLFWATIGYSLLKKVLKPESPQFDEGNYYAKAPDAQEKLQDAPTWKKVLSSAVMLGCIVGFCLCGFAPFDQYLDIAVVPMIGATILFLTGCVPVKKTLAQQPWDILIIIGSITVLGTGLSVSGGGDVIANAILDAVGLERLSPALLMTVIIVVCGTLTLFLSNGGVASLFTPVVIPLASAMGVSPVPYVIVIAIAVNLAIATPLGTAVNVQILPAGYKFMDFVKLGGPLWLIMVAALCLLAPIFYPL